MVPVLWLFLLLSIFSTTYISSLITYIIQIILYTSHYCILESGHYWWAQKNFIAIRLEGGSIRIQQLVQMKIKIKNDIIFADRFITSMILTSSLSQEEALPQYKIILLGKSKAGKTKLLVRYLYGSYEDSGVSTLMVDCSYLKKNHVKYAYYDTAGQEAYRTILNIYFKGSDAAILIYSVDSMKTFEELDYYYKKVKQEVPQCLLYIVGCKNDLPTEVPPELVQSKYKAHQYFLSSAKENEGVSTLFSTIEKDLLRINKLPSGIMNSNRFSIQKGNKKPGKEQPQPKPCCK